jgi:ribonuclease BN (tRNA processing enzyme)
MLEKIKIIGFVLVLSGIGFSMPVLQSGGQSGDTKVVLLGTGTPNTDPDRFGPATAIVVNGQPYVVDAGAGVVRRVAAAGREGVEGMRPANLTRLFITHLHSDHTVGYPDFIFTPAVVGRRQSLHVYGPPGLQNMTDHLMEAWAEDIDMRLNGLEEGIESAYQVVVHEIEPGVVYEDDNVLIRAFEVDHGSWEHAFGYRFETADRTIVISGDAAPSPALIENAMGADVLIHEVYSVEGFSRRTPPKQAYHSAFHTSTLELAEIAQRVQPGLLLLYHLLPFSATEEQLLKELTNSYGGRVVVGRDLGVY